MNDGSFAGGWAQLFARLVRDFAGRALHGLAGSPVHRMIIDSLGTPSRPFDKSKLSLFSVVKNEIFLLPAFLDHHRSLGIEQFLILVDHSDDGTLEYLLKQDDVIVLESSVKFGDEINVSPFSPFGIKKIDRAAAWLKEVITQEFFKGTHALYLDADEFLFLPPNTPSVKDLIDLMKKFRAQSVSASVVEFFPEKVDDLFAPGTPQSLTDLLTRYPYFEPVPLLRLRHFRFPEKINIAKSGELFRKYLNTPDEGMTTIKTPLVRHSASCFRRGSHRASLPPTSKILLTVAHFKFTAVSGQKFREAITANTHDSLEKYQLLERLLLEMNKNAGSFLSGSSRKFSSPQQLIEADLMLWPGSDIEHLSTW